VGVAFIISRDALHAWLGDKLQTKGSLKTQVINTNMVISTQSKMYIYLSGSDVVVTQISLAPPKP